MDPRYYESSEHADKAISWENERALLLLHLSVETTHYMSNNLNAAA